MFNWTKRSQTRARLVEADASALIARFGDYAYDEARRRVDEADSGAILDGNRPEGHWRAVKRSLSKRLGRDGLDTATRYLMDR
jgi:predicted nucleic acid-binding protein